MPEVGMPLFDKFLAAEKWEMAMSDLYDLAEIYLILPDKYTAAKGMIRRLLGASSITQDLAYAEKHLFLFYRWHVEQVIPSRQNYIDNGDEGIIGGALFHAAALSLARALDRASHGRNRVDFSRAFKKAGLEAQAEEFERFRNKELAHYDGYENRVRRHSDDRLILVVRGMESYLVPAFVRAYSAAEIGDMMARLIVCARTEVNEFIKKAEEKLFELLGSDDSIRELIISNRDKIGFEPDAFFIGSQTPNGYSFDPLGDTYSIDWQTGSD